jgi:hypothetical protein
MLDEAGRNVSQNPEGLSGLPIVKQGIIHEGPTDMADRPIFPSPSLQKLDQTAPGHNLG